MSPLTRQLTVTLRILITARQGGLHRTRTIRPAYIHPDRVAFQFCYGAPAGTTAYAARLALQELVSNGRALPGMAMQFTIQVESLRNPVRVKFTKPNRTSPFYFKVYLSPLLQLWHMLPLEHEKDGQFNYLSRRQVTNDNTFVAARIAEWIVRIETALASLADQLAQRIVPSGFSTLLEWKLHAIELTADLAASDPGFAVERAYPAIRANYKNTIRAGYPSAAGYCGVERDSLMAWGFAQRGERIKVYEKTTSRVRFECALDKLALDKVLQNLKLSRKLGSWDEIEHVCAKLAEHASKRFAPLTAAMRGVRQGSVSPVRLIGLATQGFSAEVAEHGLLTLGRNGRIQRAFDRNLVGAWHTRGVVRRVSHGHYAIADEFNDALCTMVELADGWSRNAGDQPQ